LGGLDSSVGANGHRETEADDGSKKSLGEEHPVLL
jgi:hypothetical protein